MAIEDEIMFDTDNVVSTESDNLIESDNKVINFVTGKFKRAEDARLSDEERWLRAYKITEVYTVAMYNLLKLKNLGSL